MGIRNAVQEIVLNIKKEKIYIFVKENFKENSSIAHIIVYYFLIQVLPDPPHPR